MKKVLKIGGYLVIALVIVAAVAAWWMVSQRDARLAQTYVVQDADFAVPFPLSDDEVAAIRAEREEAWRADNAEDGITLAAGTEMPDVLAEVDLDAIAAERAVARGRHLVEARYVCVECHGQDFGGGTMIDDPGIGEIMGPNLTEGEGSVVKGFTPADWSRAVRHGVAADGTPLIMPADDFVRMTDRELSDILAYIATLPPVDRQMPPVSFGPVGTVLVATDQLPLAAEMFPDHGRTHETYPPPAEPSVAFGEHLSGICTGCHNPSLSGGWRPGFPPDWAEPLNLTPHASGLEGWTFEDFDKAMRRGVRKNGENYKTPMNTVVPYAMNMTDVEMKALWAYLQSLEPVAYGEQAAQGG